MKPSDFKHYSEYMGGLGDVMLRLIGSAWYSRLDELPDGEEAAVVLMCHNPAASQIWKWHPKRERIRIFDFGFNTPFHPWENLDWRKAHDLPEKSPCPPPYDGKPINFYPSPEDNDLLASLRAVGRYAVFAPVAGSPERTFPPDIQCSIIEGLLDRGIRPVYVGLKRYGRPVPHGSSVDLMDRLSVPGTIKAIQGATAVITAHSSVLHMSWHVKSPVFLLYPKWVRDVYEKHGAVGYFFGANYTTTEHMEFPSYNREAFDRFMTTMSR